MQMTMVAKMKLIYPSTITIMGHVYFFSQDQMGRQGVQQPRKPGILREFDLPRGKSGKPGKLREFFCLSIRIFLNGLLFELLPDNDRKIICKIILVSYDINDCI